jgi:hypothetical protein
VRLCRNSFLVPQNVSFSVMPDLRSLPRTLIRGHPESHENTGFRLSPEWQLFLKTNIFLE